MEWFVKAFIRASLVWFALGIITGLAMAVHPPWVIYRPAHAHMVVAGFITMMVFGSATSCSRGCSVSPFTAGDWRSRTGGSATSASAA